MVGRDITDYVEESQREALDAAKARLADSSVVVETLVCEHRRTVVVVGSIAQQAALAALVELDALLPRDRPVVVMGDAADLSR